MTFVGNFVMPFSNNSLPANISNLFLFPTQVLSYNTRFSATGSLYMKYSRTNNLHEKNFSILIGKVQCSLFLKQCRKGLIQCKKR